MPLSKKEIAALIARKTLQTKSGGFPNVSELHKKSHDNRTLAYDSDYRADTEDKNLIDHIHTDDDNQTLIDDLSSINTVDGLDTYDFQTYLDPTLGETNFTSPDNVSQFINFEESKTLVNPELANQVMDTNVVELLPTTANRQQRIINAINELNTLLGPIPNFQDQGNNIFTWPTEPETDTEAYWNANYDISLMQNVGNDDSESFITRLKSSENNNNTNRSVEHLRDLLNQYLKDVDSTTDQDQSFLPQYQESSTGYAEVDGLNESIIVANETGNDMSFNEDQEVCDTFLSDGCPGCTSVTACNYDAEAVTDNGTCSEPAHDCSGVGDGPIVCLEVDCPTE